MVLVIAVVLYLAPLLLYAPLTDPDEGLHAAISQEMVDTVQYVVDTQLRKQHNAAVDHDVGVGAVKAEQVREMRDGDPEMGARVPVPVAWKTGTSWGFRDAWSAGVFGSYVLVVWVGNFSGEGNPSFVGVQAASEKGVAGALFYLAAYTFMVAGSFGVVTLVSRRDDDCI